MAGPKIANAGEGVTRWLAKQMENARMIAPEVNYTGDIFMNMGLRVGRFGNFVTRIVSSMFDEPAFAVAHLSGGSRRIEGLFPSDETPAISSIAYMGDSIESQRRIDGLVSDGESRPASGSVAPHVPQQHVSGARIMVSQPPRMPVCQHLPVVRVMLPPVRCCRP